MNFVPSLLIYNPLEAFIILYFFNNMTSNKINNKKIVINSYIVGSLILLFQFVIELLYGTFVYPVLSILGNIVILPCITYLYQRYVIQFGFNFITVYKYCIVYIFSNLLFLLIINRLKIVNMFVNNFMIYEEFILNLLIKIPQILILFGGIYLKRWYLHERNIKKNRK